MHEPSSAPAIVRLLSFRVLEDAPIASISPDYFFKKFEDAAEWSKLAHEMDLYFFDRIEFFPAVERSPHHIHLHRFVPARGRKSGKYSRTGASKDDGASGAPSAEGPAAAEHADPHHDTSKRVRPRLTRPRRYFEIETELVERRFPADGDLRGHFKTLRSYFCHNLIRYLTYKRLILLLAIAVFWALAFDYDVLLRTFIGTFFPGFFDTEQHSPTISLLMRLGFVATSFFFAVVIDLALNAVLFDRFKHAIEQSCFHVSTASISRTEKLRNCFDNCLKRIDEEQRQRTFESDLADRAGRWIVLVYWLAKRLEDLERFVLVELWRIRRIHFWITLVVRSATAIGAAVLAALLGLLIARAHAAGEVEATTGLVATLVLTGVLVFLNYATWKVSVKLVRESMKTQDWARYADLELQEEFRHQIYKDKSEILRWYAQFQGLVRGAH